MNSKQQSIAKTIAAKGVAVEYTHVTLGTYDEVQGASAATTTVLTVNAVLSEFTSDEFGPSVRMMELLIAGGDLPFTPREGDTVIVLGEVWVVTSWKTTKPDGVSYLQQIRVRQ